MRTDSIFAKLERHDRKAGTTYVLDLMLFLAEADGDKFGKARALIVDTWGFKTSKTALCEGYNSYLPLWRLARASAAAHSTANLPTYTAEQARLIGQRTFEMLSAPDLDPKILLGFAKLEVDRRKAENDSRRVELLEQKMSEARETLAAAAKKGGLSPETLEMIEKALKLL
jgi:IS1 family transposase